MLIVDQSTVPPDVANLYCVAPQFNWTRVGISSKMIYAQLASKYDFYSLA